MKHRSITRLLAVLASLAVIAGVAPAASLPSLGPLSARADTRDADVTGLLSGLGQFTTFSQGLATDGLLGQNLPELTLAPGGSGGAGLNDLLAKVFDPSRTAAINHCADFASLGTGTTPLTPSAGRSISVAVGNVVCGNNATSDTLPLAITETTHVNTGLAISKAGSSFTLNSTATVPVDITVTFNATFVYVPSQNYFYVVKGTATPSLGVAVSGALSGTVAASLGILGVTAATTDTSFHAHFTATVNDPAGHGRLAFTDPAAGGGTTPGELTATNASSIFTIGWDTSAPGNNTFNGNFSVTASPDPSLGLSGLGSISGTVQVAGSDLSTAAPAVTLTGFDPSSALAKFQNLTPRDLGDGLAHLAAALTSIQGAKVGALGDINLPFMQGKLSDGFKLGESLLRFLAGPDPVNHPELAAVDQKTDTPRFASIQDLVGLLRNVTDSTGAHPFNIAAVTFESGTSKLVLDFSIDRSTTVGVPLDAGPTTAYPTGTNNTNSGVTYSGTTVTDANAANWTANQWAGFSVSATASGAATTAEIQGSDAHTLTLKTPTGGGSPWSAGVPGGGAYKIVTKDPGTGAVNLGNALSGTAGILSANASSPVATVKPSYHAGIKLVLDLSAPITGTDCAGKTYRGTVVASTGCPFTSTAADGSQQIVDAIPLAPDRVLLRTGSALFYADAPINTEVHITAAAGFLKVNLDGTLCLFTTGGSCTTTPTDPSVHLISVSLKQNGTADSGGHYDLPLAQVFTLLTGNTLLGQNPNPGQLIDISMNGGGSATLTATVPGVSDFFNSTSTPVSAGITIKSITGDLTDTGAPGASHNVEITAPDFSKLLDFGNVSSDPKALFRLVLQALTALDNQLQSMPAGSGGVLSSKIPVINQSINDILSSAEGSDGTGVTYTATTLTDPNRTFDAHWLGRTITAGTNTASVVLTGIPSGHTLNLTSWTHQPAAGSAWKANSELDAAVNVLSAKPAANLQDLVTVVNSILPTNVAKAVTFKVDETEAGNPKLDLNVHWNRSFSESVPLGFNYDFGGSTGGQSLVGVGTTGTLAITGGVAATLDVLIAMTTDTTKHCAIGSADGICLAPTSGITATIAAGSDSIGIQAAFGPVSLKVGNPTDGHPGSVHAAFNAALGTTATAASGTSGVSLGSYFGGLNVALNGDHTTSASCGSGFNPSSVPLAVCASLPLYLSSDGGVTFNPITHAGSGGTTVQDAFSLRLPQTSDLAGAFTLAGNLTASGDGSSVARFDYPPSLLTDFANAVLDLNDLSNGIDGYFGFAKNALNLASAGGKLPLIGKDLQQGADFIGELQAKVDSILGPTGLNSVSTVGALQTKLNTDLANAIGSNSAQYVLNAQVIASATCNAAGSLKAPGVTAVTNPGTGSTTYSYEVFGVTSDSTIYAPPAAGASNGITTVATLTSTNKNHITWTPSSLFASYTVVRTAGGATTGVIGTGITTGSFDDTGIASTGAAPTGTPNPICLPSTSLASGNLTGIVVELKAGKGVVGSGSTAGCSNGSTTDAAKQCIPLTSVPLNIGVPGLAISAPNDGSGSGNLQVNLGYTFDVTFGLDKSLGFYLKTDTGSTGSTVLGLGISMNLPSTLKANIAFLNVCLANHQAAPDFVANPDYPCNLPATAPTPILGASFVVNLTEGHNSGKVTLAELEANPLSQYFHPKLTAGLNIDWDFQVDVAGTNNELPGIGGEFKFVWTWSNADPGADMGAHEGGNTLEFDGIYISAGKFLTGVFGSVIKEVQTIASPLKPIIDIITAPIPLLSDLSHIAGGPDITLVTLAKAFSTVAGGPSLDFIDTIVTVVKVVNQLSSYAADASVHIPIGSFSLLGTGGSVFHNAYTPDTADPGTADPVIKPKSDVPTGAAAKADADSKTGGAISQSSNGSFGFSFPIFSHPASVFNLLMGKDVTLVQFDSGPLVLGFDYSQAFGPVYAPPPVLVVIAGGASIAARIVLGFDTYGIRTGIQNGFTLHGFLDSLFIKTTDDQGHPIPAITLTGYLAAGAEVSVLIISVGIEGGIRLTINFLWHDPDNDGKLRFFEFIDNLTRGPLCLFDFSGSLNFFLKVFITIGFSIFSFSFDFTIIDITLVDFSDNHTCDIPNTPPVLGQVVGNTLYVFAGALGGESYRGTGWGNASGADETIKVQQLFDNSNNPAGIDLSLIGHTQHFDGGGLTRVLIDALGYGGKENVLMQPARQQTQNNNAAPSTPTPPFSLAAYFFGGTNDNTVKTGDGGSFLQGGNGQDKFTVGEGNSIIAAGKNATIKAGNGNNWVYAGSAPGEALTYSNNTVNLNGHDTSVPNPDSVGHGDNPPEHGAGGSAHINVGLGANHVYGGGTNAQISVASDSPLAAFPSGDPRRTCNPCTAQANFIAGGSGTNVIVGGSGGDTIYGGHQIAIPGGDPSQWMGDPGDHKDVILSNGGNATIYGGGSGNRITTKSRHGVAGHDCSGYPTANEVSCVYGGGGDNVIQGGDGDDVLYGGHGVNSHDIVRGGKGVDHIYAGDGDSILVSVSGHSVLTGGAGDDYILGGDAQFLDAPGGNPIDIAGYNLFAGSHHDGQFGLVRDSLVPVKVPQTSGPQQVIAGMGGNNHIFAGDNGDLIFGAANRSEMACQVQGGGQPMFTAPPENDTIGGNNYIVGGLGADQINGGRGNNFIQGGGGNSFLCGGGPGADEIHGGSGNVIIWGGSGNDVIYAEGGNDVIFGNAGDDTIYGGLGHNYIEGGPGTNTIYGAQQESVLIGGDAQAAMASGNNTIYGGPRNDIIIGHNGCATIDQTLVPNAPPCPTGQPSIQVFDLLSGDSGTGSAVTIKAPDANYRIFGGRGTSAITTGGGDSYIEGGTGNNVIHSGDGANVVIGGSSHAIDLPPHTSPPSGHTNITVGNGNDIVIGHNGCANDAIMSWSCPFLQPQIQVFDLRSPDSTLGPDAVITVGNGDDRIFGGRGNSTITTGNGNSYIEGGSGNEVITSGNGNNVIIGGSSHAIDLATTTPIPSGRTTITAGDGKNLVIAHNGCGNDAIMSWSCPSNTPQAPPTAFGQRPYLLLYDSILNDTTYGNGTNIHVGNGGDMVFGGLGGNFIKAGNADNYLQGGPSDSTIEGGHGNNDIVGGNSPIGLPSGVTTSALPVGANLIYADGGIGGATAPADGNNVVIGSNGSITRTDPVTYDTNRELGVVTFIHRNITRLDSYNTGSNPVLGNVNFIYGGTSDDILIGGPAGNHIFGGPPQSKAAGPIDSITCDTASRTDCNFDNTAPAGNDYIEGGNGANYLHAGGGDSDIVGGNSTLYLDPVADPQKTTAVMNSAPNYIWGGTGNDYLLAANGLITHALDHGAWKVNANDGSFVRSVYLYDLKDATHTGIGGFAHIWGENGDNHIYGENGDNWLYGGPHFDYIEGGTGSNVIQGRGGDDDIVGGNSPDSLVPAPAGQSNETIAGNLPSGRNLICGNLCGVDKTVGNPGDDVILGHNGRIGRCADSAGAHTGNDTCTWTVVKFGNQKNADGTVSGTPLGDPRQRFIDLLGQSPTETTHNGATDIEGNGGNNVIYAEDGPSVVHGGTPPGGQTATMIVNGVAPTGSMQPIRNECLPHQSALQGHDVIVGGYGDKTLCGGGGDDLIIGTRGDYKVVPFSGAPVTIGRVKGPIFTLVTYPGTGNTIYQSVDLTNERGKPVSDWQTANGYKVIFGGHGNNTIHAGAGDNFVEGADGMHIAGQAPSTAGNNIIFGGFGNTSIEGGPGNDVIYGGSGNKDIDVVRDDVGVVNKINDSGAPLPPLYPTINANPATFGISGRTSYAARFPLPAGQSYDSDPGGFSHGGGVFHTTVYGDIIYGGTGRNVMQISDEGSRMIDESGNWDLWLVCHAPYGEPNIDRSHAPALKQYVLDLAVADGATDPNDPNSSGFAEVSWAAASHGSAYPGTPGHLHCEP